MADLFENAAPAKKAKAGYPEYLQPIVNELSRRYLFGREHRKGRTGQTYILIDRDSSQEVLLKTIIPDIKDEAARSDVARTLQKECDILQPLNHKCVPTIFLSNFKGGMPYYVCTFHPGKTWEELRKENKEYSVNESAFAILALIDALDFMHRANRTHCDLHLDNILLGANVFADGLMVIDLGSGHRQTAPDSSTADRGHLAFKEGPGIQKYRKKVKRLDAWEGFVMADMRALGKALLQMIDVFFSRASHEQRGAYVQFCDQLQGSEIRNWNDVREQFAQVTDPRALVTRTEKYFHLKDGARAEIVLPASGPVPVGEAVVGVINTKVFQRLRAIKQLSFCEWFFPGGTHTRFEHSLGVFKTTIDALNHMVNDSVFKNKYSQRNIDGLLLGGLLHDIGHYPLAHVIEHYIASRLPHDKEIRQQIHHYHHSLEFIQSEPELCKAIDKHWGVDVREEALRILQRTVPSLSELLDGPIDCDKLDYLRRDAVHCGVPYGQGIDVQGVLRALRCNPSADELVVDIRGVQAVEGFIVLQDQMLSTVYWNEQIRALFAMFHAYLAHTVGKDKYKLHDLVARLRKSNGDQDALLNVFLTLPPSERAIADKVNPEKLKNLIQLHVKPDFSPIYKPFAKYTQSEVPQAKSSAMQNVYSTIFASVGSQTMGSVLPIRWENVKRLRQCYLAAFEEKRIAVEPLDVLIDVPWGKGTGRVVKVMDEQLHVCPITDVSHLNPGIFENPAAFLAPVRVYTSPPVASAASGSMDSIRTSAEEKYFDKAFRASELSVD